MTSSPFRIHTGQPSGRLRPTNALQGIWSNHLLLPGFPVRLRRFFRKGCHPLGMGGTVGGAPRSAATPLHFRAEIPGLGESKGFAKRSKGLRPSPSRHHTGSPGNHRGVERGNHPLARRGEDRRDEGSRLFPTRPDIRSHRPSTCLRERGRVQEICGYRPTLPRHGQIRRSSMATAPIDGHSSIRRSSHTYARGRDPSERTNVGQNGAATVRERARF